MIKKLFYYGFSFILNRIFGLLPLKKNRVLFLSDVREVNDLMFAADILITDYSSLIFDYALLRKPIVYFTYDLEEYENGRGLYFPFNDYIYGKIVRDTDSLISAINEEKVYEEELELFIKKFVNANDGHASEKTVEYIFHQV